MKLESDIDLGGRAWTSIGTVSGTRGSAVQIPFNGIFDGQGHTISNLKVENGKESKPAGLFGCINSNGNNKGKIVNLTVDGARISNIQETDPDHGWGTGVICGTIYTAEAIEHCVVKNATIKARHWAGGIVGKGYGSVNYNKVENLEIKLSACVNINNGSIDFADKAGGIVGQQEEGKYDIIGNEVSNVKITGYRHLGGICGYVQYGNSSNYKEVKNNTVTGGVIYQDFTNNYKNLAPGELVNELFGYVSDNVNSSDNNASGVEIVKPTIITDEATLTQAIQNGGIVTLGVDMDLTGLTGSVLITKPTTLNLNGKTLKVKGNAINVGAGAELTLEGNGKITSPSGRAILGAYGSKIIVNEGTVETTASGNRIAAIQTEGDIEINGGNFSSATGDCVLLNWPNLYGDKKVKAVINGGTFNSPGSYVLYILGSSNVCDRYVEINGGTFVGNAGVQADGLVDVIVNDGYFIQDSSNSTGHAFCAGANDNSHTNYNRGYGTNVTINGGYFYGNPGQAIGQYGQSRVKVKAAYLNKTLNFNVDETSTVNTLSTPIVKRFNGKDFSFGYQVK